MPIFPIQGSDTTQTSQNAVNKSVLGKDDFLKMLTQQMRYQDPLDPMKGDQFASQLAQFSSVEQLSNINESLTSSLNANYMLTQAINNGLSAGFVGKEVRASGDTFNRAGVETQSKMGYTLPSAATSVEIKIKNAQGQVVKTITNAPSANGDNSFTWDGEDDAHQPVPDGKYTFTVTAKDADNKSITASPFVYGRVSAVRFSADGTKFVINGQEILLSDIIEVLEG